MKMDRSYVCTECGHEYDELGNGRCDLCGGEIIAIDEIGQEEEKYPDEILEEEEKSLGFEEESPIEEESDTDDLDDKDF